MIFNNKYGITKDNYWCLLQVNNNTTSLVELNGNVVDDVTIEKICNDDQVWYFGKNKNGDYILIYYGQTTFLYDMKPIEKISTIECLERYGIERMENAIEKTSTYIPKEYERNRKINKLL